MITISPKTGVHEKKQKIKKAIYELKKKSLTLQVEEEIKNLTEQLWSIKRKRAQFKKFVRGIYKQQMQHAYPIKLKEIDKQDDQLNKELSDLIYEIQNENLLKESSPSLKKEFLNKSF